MVHRSAHPGDVLAEELKTLGVTPTELARQIAVPPNRISQIIHGKRAITGDTALRLAHWFGTDPRFWMDLQAQHEVRVAQEQAGDEIESLPTRIGLRADEKVKSSTKGGR
ncbi:MAG: HigA family addiction module antitoxin [Hyphomicrobiaceae bacterium]